MKLFRTLLLLSALIPAGLSAQEVKIPLLEKVKSSLVSFNYDYSSKTPGGKTFSLLTTGKVTMLGQAYKVEAKELEMELRSDGKDLWTLDLGAREAIVESAGEDLSGGAIFTNPALLIGYYSDVFLCTGGNGKFKLVPREGGDPSSIDLKVSGENGPVEATFRMKDGSEYLFVLKDLRFWYPEKSDKFSFSAKDLGSDWLITDLR